MTQADLDFRPLPRNPYKPGTQKHRLYERAKEGPVSNGEIIYKMRIANSTGRASEIRDFLALHGFSFDSKRIGASTEFVYEIGGRQ